MANPQLKDGFVSIANEIFEALAKIRIPGEAMQVLLVIIRQTYGWNRKEAMISNKTFVEKTGIKKQNIQRAISKLTDVNIIKVIKRDYDIAPTYCLNKDYEQWEKVIKRDYKVIKKDYSSNQKRLQEVSKEITPTPCEPLQGKACSDPKDSTKDSTKDIYRETFNFWNSQGIIVHKVFPPPSNGKTTIKTAINNLTKAQETEETIQQSILNYKKILNSDEHYFTHKWGLVEFLVKGFYKFNDWNIANNNYLKNKNGRHKTREQRMQELQEMTDRLKAEGKIK